MEGTIKRTMKSKSQEVIQEDLEEADQAKLYDSDQDIGKEKQGYDVSPVNISQERVYDEEVGSDSANQRNDA